MMNEEKEIKILLTESEYNLLDRYFKWTMNITQTNHYFGSENDIRKKGDTLGLYNDAYASSRLVKVKG